jgi:acyl dehydratase
MASEDLDLAAASPAPTAGTAPAPVKPDGLWLDDLTEGMTFRSDDYEVTQADVTEFASRYDPQLFHLDEQQARGTFFDGLAASGWHTAAITMRLLATSDAMIATGVIGTEISLKWPTPTRPGDVLHLEITVGPITPSRSRPDRASVILSYDTINQHGEIRQQTSGRVIAWRRPQPAARGAGDPRRT